MNEKNPFMLSFWLVLFKDPGMSSEKWIVFPADKDRATKLRKHNVFCDGCILTGNNYSVHHYFHINCKFFRVKFVIAINFIFKQKLP